MAKYDGSPGPPKIGDFSQKATDKVVLHTTLQHPLTLYPIAIGFVAVAAILLLQSSAIAFLVAVGGLSLGVGNWIVNYFFRRDRHASRYVESLHRALAQQRQRLLESSQGKLRAYRSLQGAAHFAAQGEEQFTRIKEKFENLQDILSQKLSRGELTYSRYCGTAEQVYLSVLDNLRDVITLLQSVSAIDDAYIHSRFRELRALPHLSDADRQELDTLEERQQLRDQQLDKVNLLLTLNEEAMTTIDQTVAAIAEMKTVQGRASMDMEPARQELEQLAQRAHKYSV